MAKKILRAYARSILSGINEGGIFSGKVTRISQEEEKGKKKSKLKFKEEDIQIEEKAKGGNEEEIVEEFKLGDIEDDMKL